MATTELEQKNGITSEKNVEATKKPLSGSKYSMCSYSGARNGKSPFSSNLTDRFCFLFVILFSRPHSNQNLA